MNQVKVFIREHGACKEVHVYQPEPFRVLRAFVGSHDVKTVRTRAEDWIKKMGYEQIREGQS